MRGITSLHLGLALILAGPALAGVGCSSDKGRAGAEVGAPINTGSLGLALTARGASGSLYRLRQAIFDVEQIGGSGGVGGGSSGGFAGDIFLDEPVPPASGGRAGSGGTSTGGRGGGISMGGFAGVAGRGGSGIGGSGFPGFSRLLFSEDDPFATTLEASLPNGDFFVTLFDGWFLEKVQGGEAVAVAATLLSAQTQFFNIQADEETFVSYRFETNGEIIDFGQGRLIIDIEVDETNGGGAPGMGEPLPVVGGLIEPGSNPHGVQAVMYSVNAPVGSSISVTSDTGDVCVSGSLGAVLDGDFATQWGAEFGFVFLDSLLQEAPWDLDGGRASGIAFTLSGQDIPPNVRFRATPGGGDPAVDIFCQDLFGLRSGQTALVPFDSLTRECWIPGGLPFEADNLRAIGWTLTTDTLESHSFDFCVSNLRPLLR